MTHKNRESPEFSCFLSTGCSLLRAEGFSCSLGVLYGGLGISKLQFLIKIIEIKFPAINFFKFQVIKPWIRIRDPDPGSGSGIRIRKPDPESGSAIRKNAGSGSISGSALNQCGSETLPLIMCPIQKTFCGKVDKKMHMYFFKSRRPAKDPCFFFNRIFHFVV